MAKRMRSGHLNKRVLVQNDANAGTDGGSADMYQPTESWQTYMHAWAEIDSGPSRKYWAAKQMYDELTHVITIRWRSSFDVTKTIRFVWTDRAGRTHTAKPLGVPVNLGRNANRWMEFACVENVT